MEVSGGRDDDSRLPCNIAVSCRGSLGGDRVELGLEASEEHPLDSELANETSSAFFMCKTTDGPGWQVAIY